MNCNIFQPNGALFIWTNNASSPSRKLVIADRHAIVKFNGIIYAFATAKVSK